MLKIVKMNRLMILSAILFAPLLAGAQTISGPATAAQYENHVYSAEGGMSSNFTWNATGGTVQSTWQTGTTYFASVYWNSTGVNQVELSEDLLFLDSKWVTVGDATPEPIATAASSLAPTSFTANWGNLQNATSFRLDVSTSNTFSTFVSGYNNLTVPGYIYQSVTGLSPNTTYYYRVRCVNPYGTSGNSNTITVVTGPNTPTATAATSLTSTSFVANWGTITEATSYRLDVSTSNTFSGFVSTYNNLTVNSTSATVSGLAPATTYYFRVRAVNASGTTANSNVITTLTVSAAPVAVASTHATSYSFVANWRSVAGASGYRLDVSDTSTFATFVAGYNNRSVSDTTELVTGFTKKGRYYYRVRSVNASGSSANSDQILAVNLYQNYVRTNTINKEGITTQSQVNNASLEEKTVQTVFFDGLGQPVQAILKQQSPSEQDIVQVTSYDEYGRNAVSYLPYTSGDDGWFKPDFLPREHANYSTSLSPQFQFYHDASKVAADSMPYSQIVFEATQLNRPVKSYGAGKAWSPSGNDRYIESRYLTNVHGTGSSATAEKVIAWTVDTNGMPVRSGVVTDYTVSGGYYVSGQLFVNTAFDEERHTVREYKNKSGQVILKKVQATDTTNLNDTTQWALTYYVYDKRGNLRHVLPPELSKRIHHRDGTSYNPTATDLNNWAFQYKYDGRNRMIQKQVPSAEAVYMVYDRRDRLVFTQDGNQRSAKQWTFTKYDLLNRPVLTGIHTADSVLLQSKMQARVNNYYAVIGSGESWYETYIGAASGNVHGYDNQSYPVESNTDNYLTVTYYDNYKFLSLYHAPAFDYHADELNDQEENYFSRVAGQVTGTKTKVLGRATWLKSVSFYDDNYRPIQTITENDQGGYDVLSSVFDFTGKVLRTSTTHFKYQPISWTSITSSSLSAGVLTSTSTSNWGAGAVSSQLLPAGADGWMEFTVTNNNVNHAGGLSDLNSSNNVSTIDYAWYILSGASVRAYESGTPKGDVIPVKTGDVLRIERAGGKVFFKKNGVIDYVSATASSQQLMADVGFFQQHARISRGRLSHTFASYASDSIRTRRDFVYDHAGRLLETWHAVNNADSVLLANNEYNELGQLVTKGLHSENGTTFNQQLDYRYNIRGWLTRINEADLGISDGGPKDYLGFELAYNNDLGTGNSAMYNGNISAMKWSSNLGLSEVNQRGYNFSYDALNRLLAASHKERDTSWVSSTSFHENNLTYDLNGNIKTLNRKGNDGSNMDILSYDYGTGGNRLLTVTDTGDKSKGFAEILTSGADFDYDANGNLIWDKNKGGEEILTNGSFDSGNAGWTITDTGSRLTFTAGEVQVTAGGSGSHLVQSTVVKGKPYVIAIDMERSAGSVTVLVGGTSFTFSTTGVHVISTIAGTSTTELRVTVSSAFVGKIKSVSQKGITVITYNHLNLPEIVTRAGDKQLRYVYTAAGAKLSQEVSEDGVTEKSTYYGGEFIYENDTLQFVNHEEGRTIPNGSDWEYQYHLKDHLGNVRMSFTTKLDADTAVATMETAQVVEEQSKFIYYNEAVKINSQLFDHTNAGTTYYSTRLRGSTNERFGLAKSISVMPGDTIRMEVFAKYLDPEEENWTTALENFMASIANSSAPVGTVVDGGLTGSIGTATFPHPSILNKGSETGEPPKAFLNYIAFDRDFNPILTDVSQTNFVRITEDAKENGNDGAHERLYAEVIVRQAGFMYIYLSNDNVALGGSEMEVYFDDFMVEHIKSPVIQMNDYYPFGLAFNSYSRENSVENRYLYNQGTGEKTFKTERIYELGLNVDQSKLRTYDYIIGRWWQPDPLADEGTLISLTPYNYSGNDPVRYSDPEGDCPWCWGAVIGAAVDYGLQVTTNLAQGKDIGDALTDVDVGSILVSAGAGAVSGGLSTVSKLKNASTLTKLAVDVVVDASASATGQVVRDGEVSLKKTVVDVVGSQTIGKSLGNTAKTSAVNSAKGKTLQAGVNTQKNIAKGKSNTTPKSKADVEGAQKKLDNYVEKKAIATGAASSGAASTIYEAVDEKKKQN